MRALLTAAVLAWAGCSGASVPPPAAPATASASPDRSGGGAFADLAAPDEPGERMVVHGTVHAADGVTPAPGVTVYVYHADASGRYAGPGVATPRLRGWLTTDGHGRYGYRTVRPGPYPGSRIPAHVHTQLWGSGWPAQNGTELLFADDPYVTAADRARSRAQGRFAFVQAPARAADGELRFTHDLRLKAQGDAFEPSNAHGWRDRPR
jgi:protocatechuate 3,4-dioxygenase beta subunit